MKSQEKEYFSKVAERGQLVVIAGPRGVGKRTIVREYLKQHPNAIKCVTVTTREMRDGEEEGREHYFVSHKEFDQMVRSHQILDYSFYKRNGYGTTKRAVEEARSAGRNVILIEDVEDAMRVRSQCEDATLIFIIPPSWEELEARIKERCGDDKEAYQEHVLNAQEQILCAGQFDYILINDTVEKTVRRLGQIIHGNRYSKNSMKSFVSSYIESEISSAVANEINSI